MFILVPSLLIAAGVFLAGRVIYKKIPKDVTKWNEDVSKEDFGPTFYQKALAIAASKSKEAVLGASTKLVYRLKITSLKTDNFFTRLLQDIKLHKSVMNEMTKEEPKDIVPIVPQVKVSPFKVELTSLTESDDSELETGFDFQKNESDVSKTEVKVSFVRQEQQLINQLAYNPKDVSAYKRLGWLYLENNRPIEARQALKMAVKLGSKDKMVVTKLLEVGGVVHKEGIGPAVLVKSTPGKKQEPQKVVLVQKIAEPAHIVKTKTLKHKPKKIKLKKA